ncbi:MAG: protein-L-isoaspartate(D-aspartate) O-methyltransferase [Bacteroidia bacterium]|nr:protein-L-isoaspartate(D-aspartate) O-methyltransferase [Bacteroidia bacterium]
MKEDYLSIGKRRKLIEEIRKAGIKNEEVLQAMSEIPRHLFIEKNLERSALLDHAYENKAIPIVAGQTISQPYTVAFQTELLEPAKGLKVLEIGTGCGYQTAILLKLGMKVYSIERQRELFESTKEFLPTLGFTGARLFYGDGFKGVPVYAPYQRIIVTCAAPYIPDALVDQLDKGGIMVIPVTKGDTEIMTKIIKDANGQISLKEFGNFKFVPMLPNVQR